MKSIINPPFLLIIILTIISAVSLVIIFTSGYDTHPLSSLFYFISAYTLTVICYKARKLAPLIKKIRNHNLVKDNDRRRKITLTFSIVYNGIYIALKVAVGMLFGIPWLVALAFYYFVVFLAKTLILFFKENDYRLSAFIATILLLLSFSLSFIARDIVKETFAFSYPGTLIYVFALYSFSFLSSAIYGFIKDRKSKDVKTKCYRTLSLALAAVSILTLQSAMFTSFSSGEETFKRYMNIILALFVVVFVVALAVYLFVFSLRLKKDKKFSDI